MTASGWLLSSRPISAYIVENMDDMTNSNAPSDLATTNIEDIEVTAEAPISQSHNILVQSWIVFQFAFAATLFVLVLILLFTAPHGIPEDAKVLHAIVDFFVVECSAFGMSIGRVPFCLGQGLFRFGSPFTTPCLTYRYVQQAKYGPQPFKKIIATWPAIEEDEAALENNGSHQPQGLVQQQVGSSSSSPETRTEPASDVATFTDTATSTITSAPTRPFFKTMLLELSYPFVVAEIVIAISFHAIFVGLLSKWVVANFTSFREGAKLVNEMVAVNNSAYAGIVPFQTQSTIWDCNKVQSLPMEIQDALKNITIWNKAEDGCSLHMGVLTLSLIDLSLNIVQCLLNIACLGVLILFSPKWTAPRLEERISMQPLNHQGSGGSGAYKSRSSVETLSSEASAHSEDEFLPEYQDNSGNARLPSYASSTVSSTSILSVNKRRK
ncbi:hypothetical protein EDD21DRAFT_379522 [Dissophora ornata]|nr:hypothetical protein BGZ58_010129 [Dissophora ornata]KAI8599545.1 hypothetical protein EDD21DRAFT_379522 [Dissophora ornata]